MRRELSKAKEAGETVAAPPFQSAQNPIRVMEADHEFAGATDGGDPGAGSIHSLRPKCACNTYRVLYALLEEFDEMTCTSMRAFGEQYSVPAGGWSWKRVSKPQNLAGHSAGILRFFSADYSKND